MYQALQPDQMNASFANAFNSKNIEHLLALYETDAILVIDELTACRGLREITEQLSGLLRLPGTMSSLNNFCVRHGDIALLRADYVVTDESGAIVLQGSSCELIRRQPDGCWRYVIDHATGASLRPREP